MGKSRYEETSEVAITLAQATDNVGLDLDESVKKWLDSVFAFEVRFRKFATGLAMWNEATIQTKGDS